MWKSPGILAHALLATVLTAAGKAPVPSESVEVVALGKVIRTGLVEAGGESPHSWVEIKLVLTNRPDRRLAIDVAGTTFVPGPAARARSSPMPTVSTTISRASATASP